jgi:DNA/RNA-binding domain of Phe-tRNA-synthetase-like protein
MDKSVSGAGGVSSHTRPSHRLRVAPEIAARFPGYAAFVIYAHDLRNGPSDGLSLGRLRAAEETARRELARRKPAAHPHMATWRSAYRSRSSMQRARSSWS